MPDLRISDLPAIAAASLAATDPLALADLSASETKKVTIKDLIQGGIPLIDDGSIPGAKVDTSIAAGSIGTTELANDAVTAIKLDDESTMVLATSAPASGDFVGQLFQNTTDNKVYAWSGSAWAAVKAAGSINSLVEGANAVLDLTIVISGDTATLTPSFAATTAAGEFAAGPAGSGGAVSMRRIAAADLPRATNSAIGGVSTPAGGGLRTEDPSAVGDNADVVLDNDITASLTTPRLVTYTDKGLVTSGRSILGTDLPTASTGTSGVIKAGTQFSVDGTGTLLHANSATSGTYTKVTINAQGHVESGTTLAASDIPNIPAAKLTSGTLDSARIGNNTIGGGKLSDSSTVKFGGAGSTANIVTFPTADFKGQYFWDEIHDDLYLWSGSAWLPVTITSGELIFAGTYDASTNLVDSVTSAGSALGLTIGGALPAAAESNNRYYLVVSESGIGTGNAPPESLAPPDMILSNGATWELIDVSNAIAGQTASNISFTPFGDISSTNVQLAIQELDTEKIGAANPVFTGDVTISTGGTLVFEGATADDFETTLTVTDPTADRTVTFQDASGTVALTSDLNDGTY